MKKSLLDKLLDFFIPDIAEGFRASIRNIVDNVILGRVEESIKLGDPVGALRAMGMDQAAFRPLEKALETAFETGGVTVASTVPRPLSGAAVFRFDVRNSRAEKWLREQSSTLVTRITEDTQTAIRNVVIEGMRDGRNPRNIALDLVGRINPTTKRREGGLIGLTVPQERWSSNATRDLKEFNERYFSREMRDKRFDRTVRAAFDKKQPLSSETINKLIGRYRDNMLELRGTNIARTEGIQSLNRSEYEAIKQAVESGTVKASQVARIWDSAGDKRVRDSHKEMDGQSVGIDEPFITPDGEKLMHPGDSSLGASGGEVINCRCRVRLSVNWLASAKKPAVPVAPVAPVVNTKALDQEMRDFVLERGRETGIEFLWGYDEKTGVKIEQLSGVRNHVTFSDSLIALISNERNKIVLHHNHPGGNSFSAGDMNVLTKFKGMSRMFAHGSDGSKYEASRGTVNLNVNDYRDLEKKIKNVLQSGVTKYNYEDFNAVHHHLIATVLNNKNKIKYSFELSDRIQKAYGRHSYIFDNIVKEFSK